MRKNIVILVILAVAAYLVGVESARSRGKNYEDLRHQVERLWRSPEAKRSRSRIAKRARKALAKTQRRVRELAG
ncbi:hypothetical protein [Microbacterium ulmi]|uniref:Uncharacterized protein n=1 Tax=Microbacterium ulmi TaxID=179095 RepID=A0A7Y2LY23_9MICO|nr:hypothetical protein [Microbacterium ulmi]NII70698.1 hypothetical protein [Microbacterium ulmi]NNH02717.1 hypothetical protein [Microbacterium ulmi]